MVLKTCSKPRLLANSILKSIEKSKGKIEFPIDPFKILEEYNIIITFSEFDNLEGILFFEKDGKSLVSININRPIQRQRFTAAHELGHVVLHSGMDKNNFMCPIRNKNHIEKEADEFASNLLMPSFELNKMVNKYGGVNGKVGLEECIYICEYFGVSFEACVKTICFRLKRFNLDVNNKELTNIIKRFKPSEKRKNIFKETNDLDLLINSIKYGYFSIINTERITGIKFLQNLVYHENRLENVNINVDEVKEIYADFRMKGSRSKYCSEQNQNIIEALGNLEMNKYCLETSDNISAFKLIKLNKLLYKFTPFPEYAGKFKTLDNMILNGYNQPINHNELFEGILKLNEVIERLIKNKDRYDLKTYIKEVALIHHNITILHPFLDGNGRVARGFVNWLLRLKKLPPIYIDSENKKEYLDALKDIDKNNDSTKLQLIIIKAMLRTMSMLHSNWN